MQNLCVNSILRNSYDLCAEHAAPIRAQIQVFLPSLCRFGHFHLTVGIVICVTDIELLGKNIPCKSSILFYFHMLGESCYFIIEI